VTPNEGRLKVGILKHLFFQVKETFSTLFFYFTASSCNLVGKADEEPLQAHFKQW
jgi:hypothetical protein